MGIKEEVYKSMGVDRPTTDVYDEGGVAVGQRDLTSRKNIEGLEGSCKDTRRCCGDDEGVVVPTDSKTNSPSPNTITLGNKIMGASE